MPDADAGAPRRGITLAYFQRRDDIFDLTPSCNAEVPPPIFLSLDETAFTLAVITHLIGAGDRHVSTPANSRGSTARQGTRGADDGVSTWSIKLTGLMASHSGLLCYLRRLFSRDIM